VHERLCRWASSRAGLGTDLGLYCERQRIANADRLIEKFFESFDLLARNPGIGHKRLDLTQRPVFFWPIRQLLDHLPEPAQTHTDCGRCARRKAHPAIPARQTVIPADLSEFRRSAYSGRESRSTPKRLSSEIFPGPKIRMMSQATRKTKGAAAANLSGWVKNPKKASRSAVM
jgi:hypothetical protein